MSAEAIKESKAFKGGQVLRESQHVERCKF